MRKIRNAAFAGLATLSLVAGMTTATADEAPAKDAKSSVSKVTSGSSEGNSGSSKKSDDSNNEGQSNLPGFKDTKAADRTPEARAKECTDADRQKNLNEVESGNPDCETRPLYKDLNDLSANPTNSSVLGKRYNADRDVTGADLLGSTQNYERQPRWAQIWLVATILGVIGSVIGLTSLPFMNFLKSRGMII